MSMFDTVRVPCKEEHCDNVLEVQTKAGPCIDKHWALSYLIKKGKLQILMAINGKELHCNECGKDWKLQLDLGGIDVNLKKTDST